MKKSIKLLMSLASIMTVANMCNYTMQTSDAGIIETGLLDDESVTLAKIRRENVTEGFSNSKIFVQFGDEISTGNYYLRFATAVKGNINKIEYTRTIQGLEDNVLNQSVIYYGISSGTETYYYDEATKSVTTDESFRGDYYWTCYTIKFKESSKFRDADITLKLRINDQLIETKTTSLMNTLNQCTIEAESDSVERVKISGAALDIGTSADQNIKFVKDLNGNGGSRITYKVDAAYEGKAILKGTFRSLPWVFELNKYVGIYINGTEYEYKNNLPEDPNKEHKEPSQCDFVTTEIGMINLNKGVNEITFLVKEGPYSQCPDFDKISIYGGMNLNEYTHKCLSKCPLCGKCRNQECEDPYVCNEKCTCTITTIEAESESVSITQAPEIKYGGVSKGNYPATNTGYIKVENDNAGASFTFNINSNKETDVLLYAYLTPKKYIDYELNSQFDMYVNDQKIDYVSEKVMRDETLLDNHWAEYFVKVKLAKIHLIEGDNTITFTAQGWDGIMMDKIELYTDVIITEIVK